VVSIPMKLSSISSTSCAARLNPWWPRPPAIEASRKSYALWSEGRWRLGGFAVRLMSFPVTFRLVLFLASFTS
jgi:hypothetical protein